MSKKEAQSLDEDLIRVWLKTYKFDKSEISHIGNSKYRVNLYTVCDNLMRSYIMIYSFHLTITNGQVINTTKV
jgi:hypothetical protein